MIEARFANAEGSGLNVVVTEGDEFGGFVGPATIYIPMAEPHPAPLARLLQLIEAGEIPAVVPFAPVMSGVPAEISDRQFAQALAVQDLISREEALAFVRTGTIPSQLQTAVNAIENADQRFAAEMLLSGATVFVRQHPIVPILGTILGKDAEALDELWRLGSTL